MKFTASEALAMQERSVDAFCLVLKPEYAARLREEQKAMNAAWDGDPYSVWRGQVIGIFVSTMAYGALERAEEDAGAEGGTPE